VADVSARLTEATRCRLRDRGVEIVEGHGALTALGGTVGGDSGREFGSGAVVLACGALAILPDWAPEGQARVLTPEGLLSSGAIPERLVVVGGGAVGVELSSLYSFFGTAVTLVEARPRLLPAQDEDLSVELSALLGARGIDLRTSCRVAEVSGGASEVVVRCASGEEAPPADCVLLAVGRRPNVRGLGLEARGVKLDRGRIVVDEHCQTSAGDVYAVGDLVHGSGFAQVAVAEGRVAAGHALGEKASMKDLHVPVCIHSSPPVASVGLSETEAREAGHEVAVGKARFEESVRGSLAEATGGLVKVVANAQHGRLLGVHIVGPRAEELVGEASLALSFGATAAELARNLHPMPGYGETLAEAAGAVRVAGGRV
jgi:dihydrolipoamide dehydrogenase